MKCISSPALDDTQIMRYVDGEADEPVVAHIKECPYCAEKASQWTLLQKGLRKQFYRSTCPTPMELGDYHLGLLPAPQALVVAQHVRECPLCTREVADLEDFLEDLARMEDNLLAQAKVLVARLVGGEKSTLTPNFAALRGEAKGPITLEADGVVIVLDIQSTKEGKVNILGQVAADDQEQWTDALVELRQGGELQFSSTVDDLGAFHAEGIIPGSKELRIIPKDRSLIVVSNFEVST
jgi:hypothetical protein